MKKIQYILKEEIKDNGFGEASVYSVYLKNSEEEIFDCLFGVKEKAEKYVMEMNA